MKKVLFYSVFPITIVLMVVAGVLKAIGTVTSDGLFEFEDWSKR